MSPCRLCGRSESPTPRNVVGAQVFDCSYLLLWNCSCGTTRAVVMWEQAEDELELQSDANQAAAAA